jgi:hypothetical protein
MRLSLRLVAAAVLAAPLAAQAAAPAPANPAKAENPLVAARKALNEVGDMNYQARTLNDVINDIKEKTKVPVLLDNSVYNFGLDPNQPTVNVNLKQVKLKNGLEKVLAPYNLKFGLTKDGLYISTEDGLTTRQLRQRVSVDCDGTEFAAAIKELAAETGANIVVDPRLKDKAKAAVTLKLDDVPLETAVRLMAEVTDLRAVRSSNVLFVTLPEKAKDFRDDGPTNPAGPNPFFPGGVPVPGVIGGFGGFGGGAVFPINPPPVPVDPVAVPDTPVQEPAKVDPPKPPAKEPAKGDPAPPPPAQATPPAPGGATPPAAPQPPPPPPVEKK